MSKKRKLKPTRQINQLINDLERNLNRFWSDGDWFQFPKSFLLAMSVDEAILLAYLINQSRVVKAYERNQGWFYCRATKIETELLFHKRKQTRVINKLREKGYLASKMKGTPAKRWLLLNLTNVFCDITDNESRVDRSVHA